MKKGSGTTLTREQLDAILRKPAYAKVNPDLAGIPASQPQRAEGSALDRRVQRKKKSDAGPQKRFAITFICYSVQPLDYDNWSIKQLQDCIVEIGMLDDDNWRVLEGRVISRKAHRPEEERTEVHIQEIDYEK